MNDALQTTLRKLRLSGLAQTLDVRLQEAQGHNLSHGEFLELILQDELLVRDERQINRRVKAAAFRELKPLDQFDWLFNPGLPKKQVFDMATCRFVRENRDVLIIGPPGTGKSFIAQAVGYQAIKLGFLVLYRSIFDVVRDFLHDEVLGEDDKVLARYLKPDLLIVDDMGMKQLPRRSGEVLFEIIMRRYETQQHDDDQQPAAGRLGQVDRRRAQRHRDPGSVFAPCGSAHLCRQELPTAKANGRLIVRAGKLHHRPEVKEDPRRPIVNLSELETCSKGSLSRPIKNPPSGLNPWPEKAKSKTAGRCGFNSWRGRRNNL